MLRSSSLASPRLRTTIRPAPTRPIYYPMDITLRDGELTMARKTSRTESGQDGSMAFSEFSSTDPAKTRGFLEKVFGWRFESVQFPMGEYLSFRTPAGGQGGIRPAQAKEIPGSTSYVRVDDLDAARKKVERGGGQIVLPRVGVPGMGGFFSFRPPGCPILAARQGAPAAAAGS